MEFLEWLHNNNILMIIGISLGFIVCSLWLMSLPILMIYTPDYFNIWSKIEIWIRLAVVVVIGIFLFADIYISETYFSEYEW